MWSPKTKVEKALLMKDWSKQTSLEVFQTKTVYSTRETPFWKGQGCPPEYISKSTERYPQDTRILSFQSSVLPTAVRTITWASSTARDAQKAMRYRFSVRYEMVE